MNPELILCIPGGWANRSDFLRRIITIEPAGRYMFAGMILADVTEKDHVPIEFCPLDPNLLHAFEIAGQGKLSAETLPLIAKHASLVYLHFPLDFSSQKERLLKYTRIIQRVGGMGVKVESSGVAHSWDRWFQLLSGSLFDLYCACVTLIGGTEYYYSCGMHHFGLPDCEVPRSIEVVEAADLMNRFNHWQIAESPKLSPGHTFSLTAEAPRFRLSLIEDTRHQTDHLFHNPKGIWRLNAIV